MSAPTNRAGLVIGAGNVTLYDPTPAHPYFRLVFCDADGARKSHSVGRDELEAFVQAKR